MTGGAIFTKQFSASRGTGGIHLQLFDADGLHCLANMAQDRGRDIPFFDAGPLVINRENVGTAYVEIDHLDGKTMYDRQLVLSPWKRENEKVKIVITKWER